MAATYATHVAQNVKTIDVGAKCPKTGWNWSGQVSHPPLRVTQTAGCPYRLVKSVLGTFESTCQDPWSYAYLILKRYFIQVKLRVSNDNQSLIIVNQGLPDWEFTTRQENLDAVDLERLRFKTNRQ